MPTHETRTKVIAVAASAAMAGAAAHGLRYGIRELLHRQAEKARVIIGKPLGEVAPYADKVWKKKYGGVPIDLLMLGDSIAAGLGADTPGETLGARLAKKLAKDLGRPVRLTTGAVVGSETSALGRQIDRLRPGYRPDVVVIVVGGNDVTHRVPVPDSVKQLEEAIGRLRDLDTAVVVGTCPDLGMLRPVPQPLRALGSRLSRSLASAQAAVAVRSGAHAVYLAQVVGPFFITNPDEMFSLDRFHPSALGYKRTAEALLPSVKAALGVEERIPFGHVAPEIQVERETEVALATEGQAEVD